jgi:hypothetical protein
MIRVHEEPGFFGRGRQLRLENGAVEVVVPLGFGPRILRYAFLGGSNMFAEVPPEVQSLNTSFGEPWHIYGGHRLWYAPEHPERSYFPDNRPVAVDTPAQGVRVRQDVEACSGLEKIVAVDLDPQGSYVTVTHTIGNCGSRSIELAPWALSAMAQGGVAVFPNPPFRPHPEGLLPSRPIVMWPFTRMNDPRWIWGERVVVLRQDPRAEEPQKAGFYDPCGYMAYLLGDVVFVKRHTPRAGPHADYGCNVETFTNALFLELETLGPLVRLEPGDTVTHLEDWYLFRDDSGFDTTETMLNEGELERALTRWIDKTVADGTS